MELLHPTRNDVCRVLSNGNEIMDSSTDHPINKIDRGSDKDGDTEQIQRMISLLLTKYSYQKDKENIDHYHLQSILNSASQHKIHNSDGSLLNAMDICRLLLVLRYNGFDSGLYLYFSMFNHSDYPNCIKFAPPSTSSVPPSPSPPLLSSSTTLPSSSSLPVKIKKEEERTVGVDYNSVFNSNGSKSRKETPKHYSEARTTRFVRKGEELTLHYLNPKETSHATRRIHLWDQHRFDIGHIESYNSTTRRRRESISIRRDERRKRRLMDLVNGFFPISSIVKKKNPIICKNNYYYR